MNLEDRIKRRLLMEHPELIHEPVEVLGPEWDLEQDLNWEWYPPFEMARIAALEAEDSANPIAQTEQVRPPLRLNIDIAAFQAVYDDLDHD